MLTKLFVKCINAEKSPRGTLTEGKSYRVVRELDNAYIIVNNLGDEHSASKERFQ